MTVALRYFSTDLFCSLWWKLNAESINLTYFSRHQKVKMFWKYASTNIFTKVEHYSDSGDNWPFLLILWGGYSCTIHLLHDPPCMIFQCIDGCRVLVPYLHVKLRYSEGKYLCVVPFSPELLCSEWPQDHQGNMTYQVANLIFLFPLVCPFQTFQCNRVPYCQETTNTSPVLHLWGRHHHQLAQTIHTCQCSGHACISTYGMISSAAGNCRHSLQANG